MSEINVTLSSFTDVLAEDPVDSQISQPLSLSPNVNTAALEPRNFDCNNVATTTVRNVGENSKHTRPAKGTGQFKEFRSVEEIDSKYRCMFSYPYFNLVQSRVIEDALYTDKSMVVCAPTGSGKTVVFEMAIVQLLMEFEDKGYHGDFKIIYMAPVKSLCTERLTEWYPKLTQLGLLCIEVTGDTDVDFSQLKPYRVIITTPEKWDILTRRWTDYRGLVEMIKLFLIDEVHILNDETRGPVLEAVVSRMKAIESSSQSAYRIERLQKQYKDGHTSLTVDEPPKIRFVAVSATVSNPEDVAAWLGNDDRTAVFHKYGEESRPVKLQRVVEGYPCPDGTSIFKFDIILNYKLWPIIQKYYNGKPTLIFCNTRKSVFLTAEALAREVTVTFSPEQKAKLTALASTLKNKKLQMLVMSGVGCHHAGLLYEERMNIEQAFRHRDLPILITTTTLAMGVNLPAHLVIIKNTQQYVNGAYQEYSISTVLQMVGRAGRPQFDTEATAVIMTRMQDKARYQSLVGGSEPLQSYLHKRLAENLNCEAALHTVTDVAQCVQWLRSTFLYVRAAKEPKRYLGLPNNAPQHLILKKIEELCVKAMNGLASSGLITMDDASCIEATEAGRLMSVYYLDFDTMKKIMKIEGTETLEQLLWIVCESHELSDMHLRVDERRCLNALNRNNAAATIRFPMKGKITTRQMKLNCLIQSILGCLPISDPSLTQEAMKIIRIAERVCKCMVAYVTRADLLNTHPKHYSAILNAVLLEKCILAHLWENSPYLSKQLKGIGPTFSTLLATAGKCTFRQIEESHPRDLERIMNKGPPAGNVLHKQVTLLPKYQLTMSPVDEKSVAIQLMLLNQHFLLDHIDSLTAGGNHKCYLLVGDSKNFVLHFTSFKDKDLLQMYDGIITLTVQRKHRFEHKIFAHCISCNFVGIDDNCEYLFKDLDQPILPSTNNPRLPIAATPKKQATKQTSIKDTYKERKRRSNETEISQSKEKKRRESSVIAKFMALKQSFGNASKEIKDDIERSLKNSTIPLDINAANPEKESVYNRIEVDNELYNENDFSESFSEIQKSSDFNTELQDGNLSDEEVVDDFKIDSILNDIESEINNNRSDVLPDIILDNRRNSAFDNDDKSLNTNSAKSTIENKITNSYYFQNDEHGKMNLTNYKNIKQPTPKSNIKNAYSFSKTGTSKKVDNYKFIELLEKNTDLSDEENQKDNPKGSSGFSKTIQNEIQKFLSKAKTKLPAENLIYKELLSNQRESNKDNNFKFNDINNIEPEITWEKTNIVNHHNENINAIENHIIASVADQERINNSSVTDVAEVIKSLSLEDKAIIDNDNAIISCSNDSVETVIIKELQTVAAPDNDIFQIPDNYNSSGFDIPPVVEQTSEIVKDNTIFEVDEDSNDSKLKEDELEKEQYYSLNNNNTERDERDNPDAAKINKTEMNDRKTAVEYENKEAQELTLYKNYINTLNDGDCIQSITDSRTAITPCSQSRYAFVKSSNISYKKDPVDMSIKENTPTELQDILSLQNYKEEMQRDKLENKKIQLTNPRNTFDDYDESEYPKSNNTESTQNFSYKGQKIDIWKKRYDNKKCSIKVVQNIKINVDITKTTNDRKTFNKENIKQPTNNGDHNSKKEVQYKNITNKDIGNIVVRENDNKYQNKPLRYNAVQFKPIDITDKIILDKKPKIANNDAFANGTRYILANNATRNNNTQDKSLDFNISQTKSPNIGLKAIQFDETVINNAEKPKKNETTANESSKPKTITDVLQKYASIFKQKAAPNYKDDTNRAPFQTNEVKPPSQSQPKKPKKLFKIKDIQNMNIDLAKVLDTDTSINYPIEPVSEEKDNQNINNSKDSKSSGIKDVVKVSRDEIKYNSSHDKGNTGYKEDQFTVVEESSESPPQSEILNEGTDSDYEIDDVDQSMLNPQTLLQCLGEEVQSQSIEPDLIPPPPEFCDLAYSPSPNNASCFEDHSKINDSYFDDETYEQNFQDITAPDVETWTVSPEKDEMFNLPYSNELSEITGPVSLSDHFKSAETVSYDNTFSAYVSRKTQLNNFKLKPKSKLRKY